MIKKITFIMTGMLLSIVCCFILSFYTHQEKLLFKGKTLSKDYQFSSPHNFEEVFLVTEDNASLHALLYKAPASTSKGIVVYFHGRGGNLATDWNDSQNRFLTRNYDVLIMDYRGFGKSLGKLSEKTLLSDAERIYEYAAARYAPENIIIYGRSLGTGVATYVASNHPTKMLILESPYFSITHLACDKIPFLPKAFLDLFLKYPLHTDKWIGSVSSHIEIFHGTSDKLIPYHNSEYLYQLNPSIQLTTIANGTHNDLFYHNDYQKRLDALFEIE